MLTVEKLKEMKLGDTFEQGTLFPGITDRKVSWELIEKTAEQGVFILTYLGVLFQTKTLKYSSLPSEVK